jgi:hypothetical protein
MNTKYKNVRPLSRIKVKLALSNINLGLPNEALSFSKMLEKVLRRALADEGVLPELTAPAPMKALDTAVRAGFVCAIGCEAIGIFSVTDLVPGLTAIRAELEDLSFLDRAEIAWFDARESIWRYYFPEAQGDEMESTEAMTLAWIETLKARLKKAQGL